MAGKGTDRRTIRVERDVWEQFAAAADRTGRDRSALIRDFILWYLGRPDAELPKRADTPDSDEGASSS